MSARLELMKILEDLEEEQAVDSAGKNLVNERKRELKEYAVMLTEQNIRDELGLKCSLKIFERIQTSVPDPFLILKYGTP